ncbi:hypothetical protein F2P56_033447 [Juglans regia]|uniref:Uncharacterized protein LOC109001614 n=2 Tax=Juglans regia TaxID=51240 RepID=A0A2I4FS80_JUGRE|nr:uncharacterized protein LOC109001614 [Juglans regia]KAF5447933.1 hypothetical protein F2P56_033447 [Juglans regia]
MNRKLYVVFYGLLLCCLFSFRLDLSLSLFPSVSSSFSFSPPHFLSRTLFLPLLSPSSLFVRQAPWLVSRASIDDGHSSPSCKTTATISFIADFPLHTVYSHFPRPSLVICESTVRCSVGCVAYKFLTGVLVKRRKSLGFSHTSLFWFRPTCVAKPYVVASVRGLHFRRRSPRPTSTPSLTLGFRPQSTGTSESTGTSHRHQGVGIARVQTQRFRQYIARVKPYHRCKIVASVKQIWTVLVTARKRHVGAVMGGSPKLGLVMVKEGTSSRLYINE